ncbi:ATP-binding protein [Paraflavitalea sp. CAU 1676]|uniref:sensor histidine kinase n=1 Tax=Paraflavitalea sp. CAU 1676 TaxID=3032598 RepID=UPI0023DB762A|nr:ATP-binding protein [Paraflavitalea sp. CAU 1676]MDF2191569.1 ATP-binding protein [Paraflavitalea sp. CAU 1676]
MMTSTTPQWQFLQGGGEMGALTRAYDWSATALGSPDTWPQSLRTTVSIVLNNRFPMFLFWGPELLCFYNDGYRPILGYDGKHPDALGKPGDGVWTEVWLVIKPFIDQVLAGGPAIWSEDQLIPIHRNGRLEDVYWTFSFSPVADEWNKVAGVLVTCTETTEKVQQLATVVEFSKELKRQVAERTAELAASNIRLRRSNLELEQFAWVASHDLQEPLRKVRVFTGMLKKNEQLSTELLAKIDASTARMSKLIQDVLDFSRLTAPEELFADVHLDAAMREVLTDFELLIAEKRAVVQYHELPVIRGIPLQINQLLTNLLSNALKFCHPQRHPHIEVTAVAVTPQEMAAYPELVPGKKYCLLQVADNGIGFGQQHAEQIFNIFQRLHSREAFGGTGIGLALCKKIVLNHQGSISARAVPGEGAVFTVLLPYE